MDASCKIQGSIHSFRLVYNMCPELWVHITTLAGSFIKNSQNLLLFSIQLKKYAVPQKEMRRPHKETFAKFVKVR